MAIKITTPRLSFIQLGCPEKCICYPIVNEDELKFQILIETDTILQSDDIMASVPGNFNLLIVDGIDNCTQSQILANTIHDFAVSISGGPVFNFQRIRISPKKVLLYWPYGLPLLNDFVNCEQVFSLAISLYFNSTLYVQRLNCFKKVCDTDYTSVLEYSNNEDGYGFNYCIDDVPNKIRLPLYISKPQFSDEESIYTKSDGSIIILKSVTKKEFEGKVDYLDKETHERIKVALSHDNVSIDTDEYNGGIRKNGNYEIEWQESNLFNEAPGKFKAFATPYLVRNNNCEDCN